MIKCDRCGEPVVESKVHRFEMNVWSDRLGKLPGPVGHLCMRCGVVVAERLTEFARGLGLPVEGTFGVAPGAGWSEGERAPFVARHRAVSCDHIGTDSPKPDCMHLHDDGTRPAAEFLRPEPPPAPRKV